MKLVCIKTYSNRAEAELVRGFLKKNDIKAMISADDAGGMHPALLWSRGGVKLIVREKDKKTALHILEDQK